MIQEFVQKARIRILSNEILNRALISVSIAFLVFIIVYWLGLFLPWYIPFSVALIHFSIPLRKLHKISEYDVSQRIDRKTGLPDYISTAYYIENISEIGNLDQDAHVITSALEKMPGINLKELFPVKLSRQKIAILAMALMLSSSILFIHLESLDFKYQLNFIKPAFSAFVEKTKTIEKLIEKKLDELLKKESKSGNKNAKDQKGKSGDAQAQSPENNTDKQADSSEKKKTEGQMDSSSESKPNGDKPNGSQSNREGSSKEGQQEKAGDNQTPNGNQSGNESKSITQKMIDGLKGAVDKMRQSMSGKNQSQSESSQSQQGQQKAGEGQQKNSQSQGEANGQKTENQGEGAAASEGNSQGQPADGKGEGSGASRSKGQGKNESKKEGSGIGSDDGKKDLKDAQDQEAMGKLNSIIGQRSKDLKGEVTVEDGGAKKQTLKTDYSQTNAKHTDKGGELERDEVPQEYQEMVKRYMDQVHKDKVKKR